MFHQGDLQSGIDAAVQQSKAVVCFVHSDNPASREWGETISNDEEIVRTLARTAVTLRIAAPSQEASFLSSFCAIPVVPVLVIIQNGTTKGILNSASTSADQLRETILAQFEEGDATKEASSSGADRVGQPPREDVPSTRSTPSVDERPSSEPSGIVPGDNTSSTCRSAGRNEHATTMNQAGMDDSRSTSRADSAAEISANPPQQQQGWSATTSSSTSPSQQDWRRIQHERERARQRERERIKEQIKRDHDERRHKLQFQNNRASNLTATDPEPNGGGNTGKRSKSQVRVQVRTFDGSMLRSNFSKENTISQSIRPWTDAEVKPAVPYSLKITLGPSLNRMVEPAEEERSLEELDLLGGCTLIMVPVAGYVHSYAGAGDGIVGSLVSKSYNLATGALSALFSGVGSVIGVGHGSQEALPGQGASVSSIGQANVNTKIKTLADQRIEEARSRNESGGQDGQKFYNGNQLDFEPRKDDED